MGNPRFELAFESRTALRNLRRDPAVARLVRRIGPFGLTLRPSPSPFEALAESITYQQLNGKAAASIFERFRGLFPRPLRPGHVLGSTGDLLRGAGLSRAKTAAIQDLAAKAEAGLVPSWAKLRKMEDEDIIRQLTEVRGIGRWTVEMLLIFRLGRPDVWPVDDFAIRKAYGNWLGIEAPAAKEMVARAGAWRPYRTVVAWYLWRSLEL